MSGKEAAYAGRIKYSEERSRKYQQRKSGKHASEMRLLERAFALIPKTHRVLDAPCGGARVSIHLAGLGYQMSAADLSEAMVKIARENFTQNGLPGPVEQQDIEKLTYPDRHFDTIVSFRLFHHFPNGDIRRRVVNELCRVAGQNVVLSYFSPVSITSVRNKLAASIGGKKSKKYPTLLSEVESYFKANGFRLVKDFAQLPLVHTLHVAVFERAGRPSAG
ncbi:MAG: class I SAM-dependent methyltransferase [Verrucomicrobia bacterium]|nr:class I SAM-dependent methyltransferase [Verrucomicrobiota bacterium]